MIINLVHNVAINIFFVIFYRVCLAQLVYPVLQEKRVSRVSRVRPGLQANPGREAREVSAAKEACLVQLVWLARRVKQGHKAPMALL